MVVRSGGGGKGGIEWLRAQQPWTERSPDPEGRNWSAGGVSVAAGGAEEWETGDREKKQVDLALIEGGTESRKRGRYPLSKQIISIFV